MKALVVGGGIMGLSCAAALARDGHAVTLLERGPLPNALASSVDRHRLIRYPYGALEGYTRMVLEAFDAWDRLWRHLGRSYYVETGTLALASGADDWVGASRIALERCGIAHRRLGAAELEARVPMLELAGVTEAITVTAEVTLIDKDTATIASTLSNDQIVALPVGQEYRDLQKLIPGVQYTQDSVRGPSAGGSGQDNVYQFDGVNVTLPLFGTLSAEPASHDIAQVTVVKGGARAIDFDRSGGFSIDSVSKSGTSQYHGQVSFQLQSDGMAADLKAANAARSRFEQDRNWTNLNLGGPLLTDRLYFYGSYYRPQFSRENRANLYGELPNYDSTRNEGFGKLTFTPSKSLLLNFSYRDSKRVEKSDLFASNASATTGTGGESRLRIGTVEGSWVIGSRSYATANYTHFANETQGRPDNIANVTPSTAVGTRLDVANLDRLGRLSVPVPVAGQTAYNAFVQPLIDRYGFLQGGVRTGGGTETMSAVAQLVQ